MQLRPKFAFLNIREPVDLTEKVDDLKGDYGSTGAVLKNEIKERSTWSTSDTNIIVMSHVGYRALPPEVRKHHGTFERGSLPSGAVDRSYYEAQVFGSLTISDVDYFLVSSPADAERLKPMRKPIYLLQSQEFHKRIVYQKGLCLFVGDSAL